MSVGEWWTDSVQLHCSPVSVVKSYVVRIHRIGGFAMCAIEIHSIDTDIDSASKTVKFVHEFAKRAFWHQWRIHWGEGDDRPLDGLQNLLSDTIFGLQTSRINSILTFAPDPTRGAYSALPDHIAGGEGHWRPLRTHLSSAPHVSLPPRSLGQSLWIRPCSTLCVVCPELTFCICYHKWLSASIKI